MAIDEAGSWANLYVRLEVKRISHQKPIRRTTLVPIGRKVFLAYVPRGDGIHHHVAGASLLRYAQASSWRADNRRLSNGEQVNRLAALSLKRSKSVDLVAIGSGTRKMFMPEQKLHTHEEVFKDHVTGQYDETIFRFRVPGGWIYTHTIVRFGSVDKNYVADTFVPDSK